MIRIQSSQLDNVVRFLLKIPRWAGEKPFFGFLILLLFALVISAAVFYQYVFLLQNAEAQNEIVQTRFDEQALQQIIQIWQEREQKFNQAGTLQSRNIFVPPQQVE
ncbi:MAG: hypothetical protein HYT49_03345 [Candidatus Wildermuthbacteria bacterium]|nr:hypothetical protein [Candidatus Wildermuthbacteria bacterium]